MADIDKRIEKLNFELKSTNKTIDDLEAKLKNMPVLSFTFNREIADLTIKIKEEKDKREEILNELKILEEKIIE